MHNKQNNSHAKHGWRHFIMLMMLVGWSHHITAGTGDLDYSFDPGAAVGMAGINVSVLQADQQILIGGSFSTVNGINRRGVARLNQQGGVDADFNPGTGVGGASAALFAIAVQPDNKILLGGNFTSFNDSPKSNLVRLLADGQLDSTFNSGTGPNCEVRGIALQTDGKIIIGGCFTIYNGSARKHVARLNADGTLDASFNPGTGANYNWLTPTIQPDGQIIVYGDFTTYNGTTRNGIARINSDGTLDTSFVPGTELGFPRAVLVQPDVLTSVQN